MGLLEAFLKAATAYLPKIDFIVIVSVAGASAILLWGGGPAGAGLAALPPIYRTVFLIATIVAVLHALRAGWQWSQGHLRERERRQHVVSHLYGLEPDERHALAYFVHAGRRTLRVARGAHAAPWKLAQMGLLERGPAIDGVPASYTVPAFVWRQLMKRKADFPKPSRR